MGKLGNRLYCKVLWVSWLDSKAQVQSKQSKYGGVCLEWRLCTGLVLCRFFSHRLHGPELFYGGVPLCMGYSWCLCLEACVHYLSPGWEWLCGKFIMGLAGCERYLNLILGLVCGLGMFLPGAARDVWAIMSCVLFRLCLWMVWVSWPGWFGWSLALTQADERFCCCRGLAACSSPPQNEVDNLLGPGTGCPRWG